MDQKAIEDAGYDKGLSAGIEQGIEQGLKQGVEQGLKQGVEQGIKQGEENKKIELAKKMKQEGIDIETIQKITELSQEEISKL